MPLNIFEPRYLAMVDDAFRDGHRLIGMIQPDVSHSPDEAHPKLFRVGCVGRITQLAEAGDGRYILELTGISRFRSSKKMTVLTQVSAMQGGYFPYLDDFTARKGEEAVESRGLARSADGFSQSQQSQGRWEGVESAPTRHW